MSLQLFCLQRTGPANTRTGAHSCIIAQFGNESFRIENKIPWWATYFISMSFQWRIIFNAGALTVVEFENGTASAVVGVSGGV